MATRKRTVITEEKHEVWIIRQADDVQDSATSAQPGPPVEFEPALAPEPIDDEQK